MVLQPTGLILFRIPLFACRLLDLCHELTRHCIHITSIVTSEMANLWC
jgi:hypothetical protein